MAELSERQLGLLDAYLATVAEGTPNMSEAARRSGYTSNNARHLLRKNKMGQYADSRVGAYFEHATRSKILQFAIRPLASDKEVEQKARHDIAPGESIDPPDITDAGDIRRFRAQSLVQLAGSSDNHTRIQALKGLRELELEIREGSKSADLPEDELAAKVAELLGS